MKYYFGFLIFHILNLQAQYVSTDTTDSLKLIHVIFRHGERTPTSTYFKDPHKYWPEGWGQLTNKGKNQMYNLGLLLRENYTSFLSEYYLPQDVFVMSSYADRTLMSAQLVLAGLYPPVKEQIWNTDLLWQPIPVKYIPRSLDNIIAIKKKCPVYDAALRAAYMSERIQHINNNNENLYKYLTENTGQEINNISTVETLYNTFTIEKLHDLPLPDWTNNVSMDTLHTLAAENLAIFTDTTLMKRLKGGALLKEIITRMSNKSQNNLKPDLDLVLYSAHDLTIVSIMRTLGFDELLKPDYGASLIFELHEVNNKYEVRLLYKSNFSEDTKNLKMKFCLAPCMLTDFIEGLRAVLPIDWEQECIDDENMH